MLGYKDIQVVCHVECSNYEVATTSILIGQMCTYCLFIANKYTLLLPVQ